MKEEAFFNALKQTKENNTQKIINNQKVFLNTPIQPNPNTQNKQPPNTTTKKPNNTKLTTKN